MSKLISFGFLTDNYIGGVYDNNNKKSMQKNKVLGEKIGHNNRVEIKSFLDMLDIEGYMLVSANTHQDGWRYKTSFLFLTEKVKSRYQDALNSAYGVLNGYLSNFKTWRCNIYKNLLVRNGRVVEDEVVYHLSLSPQYSQRRSANHRVYLDNTGVPMLIKK